jgi:hypothetical protein
LENLVCFGLSIVSGKECLKWKRSDSGHGFWFLILKAHFYRQNTFHILLAELRWDGELYWSCCNICGGRPEVHLFVASHGWMRLKIGNAKKCEYRCLQKVHKRTVKQILGMLTEVSTISKEIFRSPWKLKKILDLDSYRSWFYTFISAVKRL